MNETIPLVLCSRQFFTQSVSINNSPNLFYQEKDTISEEKVKAKFNPKQQTAIITANKKKKYYDKQGNEINMHP